MRLRSAYLACLALGIGAPLAGQSLSFLRGDPNQDSRIDISDGIAALGSLFLGNDVPDCADAMDANDDGKTDVADATFTFNFLFIGGPDPSPPYPDCGPDPTADALGCADYPQTGACEPPVDCFTEAELNALIDANIDDEVCLDTNQRFESGGIQVVVCPAADAPAQCGGAARRACPIRIESIDGVLDIAASRGLVHIEGIADDLPADVTLGVTVSCQVDLPFSGDAVLALELAPEGDGVFEIVRVLGVELENVEFSASASGGAACTLLANSLGLLRDQIIDQLEGAARDLLRDLEGEVVGQILCSGD